MKKYFIYARKSSDRDDKQALSISAQLKVCKQVASTQNLRVTKIFQESKTATKPGRQFFNEMVKRIEKDEAQGVIVWHPNRISRNAKDSGVFQWLLDN